MLAVACIGSPFGPHRSACYTVLSGGPSSAPLLPVFGIPPLVVQPVVGVPAVQQTLVHSQPQPALSTSPTLTVRDRC